MATERILRIVRQPERDGSVVRDLIEERKFTMLRSEAARLLDSLPDRKLEKRPFDESEGRALREAQALGALPRRLQPVEIEVMVGGRLRTETIAGEDHQGDIWARFTTPGVRIGRFRKPDAAELAATRAATKGWWQP